MMAFYRDKGIDMLKLGCTLPNMAIICLDKSTDAKFYPFTEGDKDLPQEIREDMVGGPSIASTRRAVVDKVFFQKSTSMCKLFVGMDASQLYPYSMSQPIQTRLLRVGISIRRPTDLYHDRTVPAFLKKLSCLVFNEQDQNAESKASI